jgi:hypothetical protein
MKILCLNQVQKLVNTELMIGHFRVKDKYYKTVNIFQFHSSLL